MVIQLAETTIIEKTEPLTKNIIFFIFIYSFLIICYVLFNYQTILDKIKIIYIISMLIFLSLLIFFIIEFYSEKSKIYLNMENNTEIANIINKLNLVAPNFNYSNLSTNLNNLNILKTKLTELNLNRNIQVNQNINTNAILDFNNIETLKNNIDKKILNIQEINNNIKNIFNENDFKYIFSKNINKYYNDILNIYSVINFTLNSNLSYFQNKLKLIYLLPSEVNIEQTLDNYKYIFNQYLGIIKSLNNSNLTTNDSIYIYYKNFNKISEQYINNIKNIESKIGNLPYIYYPIFHNGNIIDYNYTNLIDPIINNCNFEKIIDTQYTFQSFPNGFNLKYNDKFGIRGLFTNNTLYIYQLDGNNINELIYCNSLLIYTSPYNIYFSKDNDNYVNLENITTNKNGLNLGSGIWTNTNTINCYSFGYPNYNYISDIFINSPFNFTISSATLSSHNYIIYIYFRNHNNENNHIIVFFNDLFTHISILNNNYQKIQKINYIKGSTPIFS